MAWIAAPWTLKRAGIAGMNWRNAALIAEQNPRRFYPRVDDKLLTKKLAQAAGIAVPALYAEVRTNHDAADMHGILDPLSDFVVKPAHGAGGDGIFVIDGRAGELFRKSSGALVTHEAIEVMYVVMWICVWLCEYIVGNAYGCVSSHVDMRMVM